MHTQDKALTLTYLTKNATLTHLLSQPKGAYERRDGVSYYWIYISYIEINEVYMVSHLVLHYEKSSGMRMHLNIRYRIVYHALVIWLGGAQP